MKVIDLLNKIANGEEVPNEIKIGDDYYYRNIRADVVRIDFLYREKETTELWLDYGNIHLNEEVEIIEENNKIEKLNLFDLTVDNNEKDEDGNDLELHYTGVADTFDEVYDKLNEIIDAINEMKNGQNQ